MTTPEIETISEAEDDVRHENAREKFHLGDRVRPTQAGIDQCGTRADRRAIVVGFGREPNLVAVRTVNTVSRHVYDASFWEVDA